MRLDKYVLEVGESGMIFEFVSEGPRGRIEKLVIFTRMARPDLYNLAFGDKDHLTGEIDDCSRSNNGDTDKVLATVVQTVVVFTDLFPEARIYAKGSTAARTRLYQIGIAKYLEEIQDRFEIYGMASGKWEPFEIGRSYTEFIAKKKSGGNAI